MCPEVLPNDQIQSGIKPRLFERSYYLLMIDNQSCQVVDACDVLHQGDSLTLAG